MPESRTKELQERLFKENTKPSTADIIRFWRRANTEDGGRFNFRHPRVSSVGICQRKNVATHLGLIENNVDQFYVEAGFSLQSRALWIIQQIFPGAVEEVAVPTNVEFEGDHLITHPDIYIPEINLASQLKSCKEKIFSKSKILKDYHHAQAMLEWYCWHKAGHCITMDNRRIDAVPDRYEVLYMARENYSITLESVPFHFDLKWGRELYNKFKETGEFVKRGELPPRPYTSPSFDCGWTDAEGNWGACGLHELCWGKKYEPRVFKRGGYSGNFKSNYKSDLDNWYLNSIIGSN